MYEKRTNLASTGALILTAFISFLFSVHAVINVSSAENEPETLLSTFGEGKVTIRLYTDYFCGPCKAMEPKIEHLLKELVDKKVATVTFIDTPFHKFSSLYVRYFLYALNGNKRTLDYALSVRNALIEASDKKLDSKEKLETHLESRGIKVNKFDPKPVFEAFTKYLRDDRINATPTCVIIRDGKKEVYVGAKEVPEALSELIKKGKK